VWPFFSPRNNIPPFNPILNHHFMFPQQGVKHGSYLLKFRANHGSIFASGSQIYPLCNTNTFLRKYLQNCTEYNISHEADTHTAAQEISHLFRNKKFYCNVHNRHPQNRSQATSLTLHHISFKIYAVWHKVVTLQY
jgi:hypothetical protein